MAISPIDSSVYAGLIDSIGTFPSKSSLTQAVPAAYTEAEDFSSGVDLSGYYSNIANSDLFREVANNVAESAATLDEVMVQALENGMSVEDAVNINCALHAYKANCAVAKSTFELKI